MHERVVDAFTRGWLEPGPHAWDDLLAEDVELTQPLVPSGRGRTLWHREMARLLAFLPDLRGEVTGWMGRDDVVFIGIRLTATLGGKPVAVEAVDRLRIDEAGVVLARDSFFDPTPVALAVIRRPSAWWPWWRSGLGPLLGRRRFLNTKETL